MKMFFSVLIFFSNFSFAQKAFDTTLVQQFDSLKKLDQFWRNEQIKLQNGEDVSTSLTKDEIIIKSNQTDSLNHIVLKNIVEMHGFPGIDLVGKEGSGTFWLLMQHQDSYPDFQLYVLGLMEAELKTGNANKVNYAYLLDRVKINTQQAQVYGTQMELNKDETSYIPKNCIDIENLNKRRAEMNLPPIEEYIEMMNTRFKGTLKNK